MLLSAVMLKDKHLFFIRAFLGVFVILNLRWRDFQQCKDPITIQSLILDFRSGAESYLYFSFKDKCVYHRHSQSYVELL